MRLAILNPVPELNMPLLKPLSQAVHLISISMYLWANAINATLVEKMDHLLGIDWFISSISYYLNKGRLKMTGRLVHKLCALTLKIPCGINTDALITYTNHHFLKGAKCWSISNVTHTHLVWLMPYNMYIYIYIYIHVGLYILLASDPTKLYIYIYVCMFVCIYIFIHSLQTFI